MVGQGRIWITTRAFRLLFIFHFLAQLLRRGPDEQLVIGLASHLRKTLSSTWTLSESGVCGPTRPDVYRADIEGPGYCVFAVVGEGESKIVSKEVRIPQPKTREENMVAMAEEGLKLVLDTLKAQE